MPDIVNDLSGTGSSPSNVGLLGGVSWLGMVGITCGVGTLGVATYAAVRRAARVSTARKRLSELLIDAARGGSVRIVITGATSGVGEELVREFSKHSSVSLLLGCRNVDRATKIVNSLGAASPHRVAHLDCLDLGTVRAFTEEAHSFLSDGADIGHSTGLRLLVNNAGVMRPPQKTSKEGLDPTWQTNFLAPYCISESLAERWKSAAGHQLPLRIVNVGSRLEKRSRLDEQLLENVQKGEGPKQTAYSDSKHAMMLWVAARAPLLSSDAGVWMHATTPGMVDTQLGRYSVAPWLWPLTKPIRWLLLKSPAEGALSAVAAGLRDGAVSPPAGQYLDGEKHLEDLPNSRAGSNVFAEKVIAFARTATHQ
eukprot:gnl/MRDRNA2_/MRDRNA2_56620_c0_seq1.p1 gnl/MRDRNA2_/MRDRNA2_56620_c0~~gnl/MRDRNA2_/MRDRNA2_56620_c0_seq1.p1  ORF type:complete len:367 (+),score=52.73 gnl/MRDRNA2_/MRDRNA2_56620_c0_seq1:75-1175(+)